MSSDLRAVLPEPGQSWWRGGLQTEGMFFPRWVLALGFGLSVTVATIALLQATVTPWRTLLALGAVAPWTCDAGLLFAPRSSLWTNEWFHRFLVPAIGIPSILLLTPNSGSIASMLLCYFIGERATSERPRDSAMLLVIVIGGIVLHMRAAHAPYDTPHAWISWIIGVGSAWIIGFVFQRQIRLITQLREAQASLAGKAATDERQRIAREVHDVIAHSLTVTMLHLTAARLTLEHDPSANEDVVSALEEAERVGRESLHDIRRTVGLLTTGSVDAPSAPAPAAEDLTALADEFSRAGQRVTLSVDGDLTNLSLPAGLALYRIIQESLTNVAKHAPGSAATVEVSVGDGLVQFRVTNPAGGGAPGARQPGGGHGLVGMGQRADLLGGHVTAGHADGQWVVWGALPRTISMETPRPSPWMPSDEATLTSG